MDMKTSVNNKNQINNFQISSYSVKISLRISKKGLDILSSVKTFEYNN